MDIIHIGLGTGGRQWLHMVRDHLECRSIACVDPEPSALEWVQAHFPTLKTACYKSLAEALKHIQADAVIIASPPALHATQAIEALEAGLGVMIEKPFAPSLAEGVRIVETARRTKRPVMVAQKSRFMRCERMLRQLVHAGQVGTITHVSCIDQQARPATDNGLAQTDYAQLLDTGTQHFDSLRSILGVQPVRVIARCGKAPWSPYRHGSTTEALLEMEHTIHVQYYGSLTSNRSTHSWWIEGEKGVLWADRRVWWRKRGWRFFLPMRWHKIPPGEAHTFPYAGATSLLKQLRAAVVEGTRPETHADDTLWTLAMVEAARLSDKAGKAIRIAEVFAAAGVPHTALASAIIG